MEFVNGRDLDTVSHLRSSGTLNDENTDFKAPGGSSSQVIAKCDWRLHQAQSKLDSRPGRDFVETLVRKL